MNAEDFIVMLMAVFVVGCLWFYLLQVLWQENPVMLITCVTLGLVVSWLNGDWE